MNSFQLPIQYLSLPIIITSKDIMNGMLNRRQVTQGYKVLLFIGYTLAIYACQIIAAIFQEKLYKVPYANNKIPNQSDIFSDQITPNSVISGIACMIGYLCMKDEEMTFNIPLIKVGKVAFCDFVIHICLIAALLRTDYTTLLVVNSLGLLSVVIIGSLFTGVKAREGEGQGQIDGEGRSVDKSKIGVQKIWICSIICIGVILFSISGNAQNNQTQKKQIIGGTLVTILIFGIALILEGFKPDLVQQIKQEHKPSSMFLYFSLTGTQFIVSLIASILTWKIHYFLHFAMDHDHLLTDLMVYSMLNAMSIMFIYKLMSMFRQHVYPLVATTRKCFTVGINVFYYGHHLAGLQWMSIGLVFGGVLIEIINNYNLAQKLLPKENVRSKEGNNYNKLIAKQQNYHSKTKGYNPNELDFQVQGI